MNFFKNIKIIWLQHRVYKYTLKSQDALSKSSHLLNLSHKYEDSAQGSIKMFGSDSESAIKYYKLSSEYAIKSDHFKHLSDIYLDKKLDLETELCSLTYRKV